jgi:hypothetical protein
MDKMFKELLEGRMLVRGGYKAPVIIEELNLKWGNQVFPLVSLKDSEFYRLKETLNIKDLSVLMDGCELTKEKFDDHKEEH